MSFFEDLKRRNVFRVAAAYAFVAWLVIQVAETVFPLFGFGDAPARIVVIVLAIGFPITLIFSWVYEFTSDGLKLERDVDHSRPSTQHSERKLDRMIIIALTLALGYFAIDKFILGPDGSNDDPSIAVLPFKDMSPDGDQAYFGNGMAAQLRNDLVQLDCLSVASGESTEIVKNYETLSEKAEALNVVNILEGSIRKNDDRILITAHLTSIADNEILWSETYDRKFENIFVIQEEIGTAVSGALGVRLADCGVNAYLGAGTRKIEAYEAFLKVDRGFASEAGIRHLNRAIELDPNYAAAWSSLAIGHLLRRLFKYPGENLESDELAFAYVLRAIELDPEVAQSNSILGVLLQVKNDWIGAEEAHLKALSLRSGRQDHNQYAGFFLRTGHSAAALEHYLKSEALEPLPGYFRFRVHVALAQERYADARDGWAYDPTFLPNRGFDLTVALHDGDSEEIKAILAAKRPDQTSTIELYGPVLEVFDSPEMVLSKLREIYADNDSRWPTKLTDIALLAAYFGDEEFALQTMGEETRLGSPRFYVAWYPLMAGVRQSQGFKELVTEMNLVKYWREKGWPDRCRPLGADDFECW